MFSLFCILFAVLSLTIPISKSATYHAPENCGVSWADRIVGGSSASLGQYPWIARLGYLIGRQLQFDCGGALVSDRHVLTAGHCVTGLAIGVKIHYVDLGENIADHEPDCNPDSVCADPVQRFTIASTEVHPDYNHPAFKNDIAVIRLRSKALITQWVLPVCLPVDDAAAWQSGFAEVAGFGLSNMGSDAAQRTPNLQTLKVPILGLDRCAIIFEPTISIDERQICVGGKLGQDSCSGDSGGPLVKAMSNVRFADPRYVLIGIVSFGLTECGKTATPSIYTNVHSYMAWIIEQMH